MNNSSVLETFKVRVEHMNVAQLKELIKNMNKEMIKGRPLLGDRAIDEDCLYYLYQRVKRLAPAGEADNEAERLAKKHGVSLKVAQNFLDRRKIKPAPEPEPAPARVDESVELRDLRPYRMQEGR